MPLRSLSWAPVVPDRFRYNSLPSKRSIRLLSVTPPKHSHGQLQCRLHSFNLADCPPFDALSYSWRDPILSESEIVTGKPDVEIPDTFHEIVVDGRSTMVTENLFSALSTLSKQALSGEGKIQELRHISYIWADALCIDQTNNDEKADQISLMGDIYASARTVVIWLGPCTPELEDVVWLHTDFLSRLDDLVDAKGFHEATGYSPLDPAFLRALGYGPDDVPLRLWYRRWASYFRFFRQRRWFGRAWVVQEAALAREIVVCCGGGSSSSSSSDSLDDDPKTEGSCAEDGEGAEDGGLVTLPWGQLWALSRLVGLCKWAAVLAPWDMEQKDVGLASLDAIAALQGCYRAGGPLGAAWRACWAPVWRARSDADFWWCFLMWAMNMVWDQACAVPADQVYCVLGIANRFWPESTPQVVVPDYASPPQDVFVAMARLFLEKVPSLALLASLEDRTEKVLPGLPSWTPDWSASRVSVLQLGFAVVQGRPAYDASLVDSWKTPLCRFDTRALLLRGAEFDTVVQVSEDLGKVVKENWAIPCMEICASLDKFYPATGEHRVEALWRTLIANCMEDQMPAPSPAAETFKDWAWMMLALGLYTRRDRGQPCGEYIRRLSCLNELAGDDEAPVLLPFRKQVLWRADFLQSRSDRIGEGKDEADMDFIQEAQGKSLVFATALSFAGQRRLYRTSRGYLGLGPKSMREGDAVWLICGGRAPFIMRKVAEQAEYEMMGETYLHGFMHGEMLKRLKDMHEIRIV